MAVLLALVSAVAYGLADFAGGLVSRHVSPRTTPWAVAVVGQLSSTVCTALIAVTVTGHPSPEDYLWGVLAGVGSGAGTGFLYRGFAAGRMSVVAPVSAVGAAVVPVLVGTLSGERPSALVWAGVVCALPGIWLVSSSTEELPESPRHGHTEESLRAGLVDGVLAGLGFGVLFASLGQVPESAGLWPLTLAQLASVPTVIVLAVALRSAWLPRERAALWAVVTGPLAAAATGAFMLAAQRGYLTITSVLGSLYPAVTVLLATLVLKERIHAVQGAGLALCALAVALVVVG